MTTAAQNNQYIDQRKDREDESKEKRRKKRKKKEEEEVLPQVPIPRPPELGLLSNGVYTEREVFGFACFCFLPRFIF